MMAERFWHKVEFLLSLTALFLLCAIFITIQAFRIEPSDARCDRFTYSWSPALEAVMYHWETFENHQFSFKTPYFGFEPTDQIEEKWNELLPKNPIAIPSSQLGELGQVDSVDDPAWVRNPHDDSKILALPEYSVQLGCLNFLRQLGYRSNRDFTHLKSFQGEDSLVWERAYQCIERLRHAIMCWGDIGAITLYYNGNSGREQGLSRNVSFDFGTLHYCRNFDAINEWSHEKGVKSIEMDNLWWGGARNK